MNRYERQPLSAGEAEIEYLDGDIRVLRPGAFVRCAATGVPIRWKICATGTSICKSLTPVTKPNCSVWASSSANSISEKRPRA